MKDEIAEVVVNASIDEQSVSAARSYPDLKIMCVRCGVSHKGSEFEPHLQAHLDGEAQRTAPIPSHWEAL